MEFTAETVGGGLRLGLAQGVPRDLGLHVAEVAVQAARSGATRPQRLPLPGGVLAHLKVIQLTRLLPLTHRLRPSRAVREARGLGEAARRGLPCVPLLCWGERRLLGLVDYGFIATRHVDAPSCHLAWREGRDPRILESVVDELIALHRAGLIHGDADARNWLWTPPRPTVLDLPSWGRFGWHGQRLDLLRLLASFHWLTGGPELPARMLERYCERGPELPGDRRALLEDAARRAEAVRRA